MQCYPLFIQASQPKVSIRIKLISKLLVLNQTQNMTKYSGEKKDFIAILSSDKFATKI